MSDAIPLPPNPNIQNYKKLAKGLLRASKSDDDEALHEWAKRWLTSIAKLQNGADTDESHGQIDFETTRLAKTWRDLGQKDPALTDAQLFIARAHGFASWPRFARHMEDRTQATSPVSQFEAAADAIANGDFHALEARLQANPALTKERSTREHRSTLLHYISANGVEDFRQKTPTNIVEIAKLLLHAGADVNAESDAYGGRSTTLGLTATSCHPERAGVQLRLLGLLIDHGAVIDGAGELGAVNACLRNGREEAAVYLASRGACLDLEGAAGIGRLDLVNGFIDGDGRPRPPATSEQLRAGFAWACEFGRAEIVEFLLQRSLTVDVRLPHDGQTGLHWAAFGGHVVTVRLLLQRGAQVDARDKHFRRTPLDWALFRWGNSANTVKDRRYHETVRLLISAGATVDSRWLDGDADNQMIVRRLSADAPMLAALRGQQTG